jgi:hypothetical protein
MEIEGVQWRRPKITLRALEHRKRLEEEVMREVRVLRGKDPHVYPGNPRPGLV